MIGTTDTQIKVAYEINHMSPEQIAEDQGCELVAIKAKLMEVSSVYRKDCGAEPADQDRLNFTDEQLETVNGIIFENATCATLPDGSVDYRTRQRAAEYIRDDKKGRKEVVRQIANGHTFNILNFNQEIQRARELSEVARKQLKEPIAV